MGRQYRCIQYEAKTESIKEIRDRKKVTNACLGYIHCNRYDGNVMNGDTAPQKQIQDFAKASMFGRVPFARKNNETN